MNLKLTDKEAFELSWFITTVLAWGSGGPYGDGEKIIERKGESTMRRISAKLKATPLKVA